ncbi:MAG: dihydrodipicolinate synthase family protein [Acidobacteriota bacterium]
MISESTSGVFIISVTPFTDAGEIDYRSFDTLIDFYIEKGVHGLAILGMMGEAQKLTLDEAVQVTRYVLRRVSDRVPVIVGVSNAALAHIRQLSLIAMDAGAAGLLLAPVPTLRTDDQIYSYYATVFEAIGPGIPVAYQDYPQSTGVHISVSAFLRMVRAFPQIVMLKHEDCPGLGKITHIRAESARQELRRVSILVGNGGLYLPLELRRGADGAMTGFAYPEMLVQVFERFRAGDFEGAEDVFDRYLPLVRYEQQPVFGLAVRKETLRRRGAIASAAVRKPGPVFTAEDRAELDRLLTRLERVREE